jgi:hypothetical protein
MRLRFLVPVAALICLASADVFNITTCYCHDRWDPPGNREDYTETGTFFNFAYYNEHLARTYYLNTTQRFAGKLYGQGEQKNSMPKLETLCRTFDDGNELCYYRKGLQIRGRLRFNQHVRHLDFPGRHPDYTFRSQAFIDCQEHCIVEVGMPDLDEGLTNMMSYVTKDICRDDPEGSCFRKTPAGW